MTKNLSFYDVYKLDRERIDLRVYASDSALLNEETALKMECNWKYDFNWGKFKLPDDFLTKNYLHILYDAFEYPNEFTGTYTVTLLKKDDKNYIGSESFDLDNYFLTNKRNSHEILFTFNSTIYFCNR